MKNVTKPGQRHSCRSWKALFFRLSDNRTPFVPAVFLLSSLFLTGCFPVRPRPAVTRTTLGPAVSSSASAFTSVSSEAGMLPYGVRLQTDPSVLVSCELERIVDGDTMIVRDPDGNRLRVRLTGIDAPESVAEDKSRNTEEGKAASAFLKELLKDTKTVFLEYDAERTDQYNRTLAYVWIRYEDTYVMVNEIILAAGHAKPVYIKPNLKYADDFRKYEK